MRKAGRALLIALLVVLCLPVTAALASTEANPILYVSGAPDLGIVEYFDPSSAQYQGYCPGLLGEFSAQCGYDVRYLPVGGSEKRAEKLRNIQADLVTAASFEHFYTQAQWENGVTILTAEQDGQPVEYRLLFTDAADDALKTRLAAFVAAYPQARADGLFLNAWAGKAEAIRPLFLIAAAAAALLLVLVLLLVIHRLKRKLKKSSVDLEIDPVTGIGNDSYLRSCYGNCISDKNRALYSAIYFRLDYDTPSGKDAAERQNKTLRHIAELLRDNSGLEDILARVDEKGFFVLRAEPHGAEITEWVQRMLTLIDAYLEGTPQSDAVYAGILPLKSGDRDLDSIIFNASYSSRYAKKNGCRSAVYSRSVVESVQEEKELRAALGRAFDEDQFVIYLQFFVDGTNGAILGAEALSRWNHPSKGLLTPGKYIDLLESGRWGEQYDFMVLDKACALLDELCRQDKTFFISCNFLRTTIATPGFLERFEQVIERYSFPRECLLFEITEYNIVENKELLYSNIERLRALGVQTVIDDFGNGYSDVFDLGHFISDGVKLDKILVSGSTTEKDDIVLSGMIRIFAELGVTVIAEGIETQAQADRLLRLGCSVFQGYHYYLPMPASEAKRLVAKKKA